MTVTGACRRRASRWWRWEALTIPSTRSRSTRREWFSTRLASQIVLLFKFPRDDHRPIGEGLAVGVECGVGVLDVLGRLRPDGEQAKGRRAIDVQRQDEARVARASHRLEKRVYATSRTGAVSANISITLRLNAGRSVGLRLVTSLPSRTTSSSTQFAPALMRSVLSDGHDVIVLPFA